MNTIDDERRGPGARTTLPVALAALAYAASLALAGPVWEEDSDGGADAGALPPGGQVTTGSGPLGKISGKLETSAGPGAPDAIDLYLIRVCDPEQFLASMFPPDGGGSEFGGRLYLFRAAPGPLAFGLVANDDADDGILVPRLTPVADDGSGAFVDVPGRYWLGVTREDQEAIGAGGLICAFGSPTEISGPDGDGGSDPLANWNPTAAPGGAYEVALVGVTFGGGPDLDCNCNGILDACEIASGEASDENGNGIIDACECQADFDGDGQVGFPDLVELLAAWGGGGIDTYDLDCDGLIGFDDLLALIAAWGRC